MRLSLVGEPFIVRRVLLRLLRGVPAPAAGAAPPPASAGEPLLRDTDAMDIAGLQALIEQVRWMIAAHDKRSEVFGQRAATVLGFDGVIMSLLVAGFALIKNNVEFTFPFLVNAVAVVVLPVVSAVVCLSALWPREITIPEASRLRGYWTTFQQPNRRCARRRRSSTSSSAARRTP